MGIEQEKIQAINFGGTPGLIDRRPPKEKVAQELMHKLTYEIEAFWSVDIQRNAVGELVPTVTTIIDAPTTEDQHDSIQTHLWAIADILREIYTP